MSKPIDALRVHFTQHWCRHSQETTLRQGSRKDITYGCDLRGCNVPDGTDPCSDHDFMLCPLDQPRHEREREAKGGKS